MPAPEYIVTIEGIERDALLQTISINETANGTNVLKVDLDSEDASYRPALDDEVIVTEDGTRIFGGYVIGTREFAQAGVANEAIVTSVECADFNSIAQRRYVNETIPAGTVKAALTFLAPYYTDYGVTLDAAQINGPTLTDITYRWVRLDVVLKDLSKRTRDLGRGLLWEIDYNKELRMFDPSTLSAFLFDEQDGRQFGDVVVESTRDDTYANRVIVIGEDVIATGTMDTFVGDGSTDTFVLTYTFSYGRGFVNNNGTNESLNAIPTAVPGSQWDYIAATNSIQRVIGAPANGNVITITYDGTGSSNALAENVSEQALPRGVWEKVVLSDAVFTAASALALAESILAASITSQRKVHYRTFELGLHPGQLQPILSPKRNLDEDFTLTDVDINNEPGSEQLARSVSAIEGSFLRGKLELYEDWLQSGASTASIPAVQNTPSAGGPEVLTLHPMNNERPAADYAIWLKRGRRPVLQFDESVDTDAVFSGIMSSLGTNGIIVRLIVTPSFGHASNTGQTVRFEVSIERGNTDVDTDSFAAAQAGSSALNATGGPPVIIDVAFTTSQIDGVLQGDMCRVQVTRTPTHATDNYPFEIDMLMGYVLAA